MHKLVKADGASIGTVVHTIFKRAIGVSAVRTGAVVSEAGDW